MKNIKDLEKKYDDLEREISDFIVESGLYIERENNISERFSTAVFGHLDILLNTARELFVVSVTGYIATLALSKVTNIGLIQLFLIIVMIVSIVGAILIIDLRSKIADNIYKQVQSSLTKYDNLMKIKFNGLEERVSKTAAEVKRLNKGRQSSVNQK